MWHNECHVTCLTLHPQVPTLKNPAIREGRRKDMKRTRVMGFLEVIHFSNVARQLYQTTRPRVSDTVFLRLLSICPERVRDQRQCCSSDLCIQDCHRLIIKALLHGAINCSYICNRIAATFECAITHRQSV